MAIVTDGPMMESADKWTSSYLQQLEAAHQQELLMKVAIAIAVVALVVAAVWYGPRLWRRATAALAGPVRMPDPER